MAVRMRIRPIAAVVLALSLAPALVRADDEVMLSCKEHRTEVEVTFKPELEVKDLVDWAMGFTCKNFVYDPRIVATGRKVAIVAPKKLSPPEAYELFVTSLRSLGLEIVKDGPAMQIVEAQGAKKSSLPIVTSAPGGNQLVRMVLRPSFAKPEALKPALDSLRSEAGDIQQVGGVLLVTDTASHVRDMVSLAKLLDVPNGADAIYTIGVQHGSAKAIATEIEPLLGTKFTIDERTNTLVLAAPEPVYERAKALVERLDLELASDTGASIHVYPLANAIADELQKTLSAGVEQMSLEGKAKIMADSKSNKLIVLSSARDYLAIRDVIRQLDEPRRQVYIETVILEVDISSGMDIGSSSHWGKEVSNGNAIVLGGVQTSSLRTTDIKDSVGNASGLISGIVGSPLGASQTILGTSIPSFAVLFQALATSSNTNVVSTPSIIAVDNEQSTFKVGQNVPYKKGTIPVSPTSTAITTTNIDRQDLNLELDIKPHISSGDNVLLEIKHDSKELGDQSSELGPTWTTRGFETRVVVGDEQTVVLTGMTQERDISSASKVPLLGDLPLLGYFFKYTSHTKKKTNLLILLTPYIIKDQSDLERIQLRKQREHDEFVSSYYALGHMEYRPAIDYGHKRGVLEEINRQVEAVEQDSQSRGMLTAPPHVETGPL
jgi:general secretion pathway protein D